MLPRENQMKYYFAMIALGISAMLLNPMPPCSHATTLQGKSFRCSNQDLKGDGSGSAKLSLIARFASESTIDGTLTLDMPSRQICDFGSITFSANRNPSTGVWQGNSLSFKVTPDGYMRDFQYSRSAGSHGTCRVAVEKLAISGSVFPWLYLLSD